MHKSFILAPQEQQNKQARERNARLDADIARERAVHARRAKQAESLQAALAAKRVWKP